MAPQNVCVADLAALMPGVAGRRMARGDRNTHKAKGQRMTSALAFLRSTESACEWVNLVILAHRNRHSHTHGASAPPGVAHDPPEI